MSSIIYQANPDVSCRVEAPAEGAILFNPDTSAVLAINNTGLELWRALANPTSPEDLVTLLLASYEDAPAEQLTNDVQSYLQALLPGGFIGQVL